jgi:hypothetical protein
MTKRRLHTRPPRGSTGSLAALAALALLLAGCGARPQQAVGVSRGPVVHRLLCEGGPVATERVAERPPFTIRDADGNPAMQVTRVPARGILRGDGKLVTAARFADGRDAYCRAKRQDRAAAIAVGFAAAVLVLAYWVRRRRVRRAYR